MKPPFPILFPPPEIWNEPPLTGNQKRRQLAKEIGMLSGIVTLVTSSVVMGGRWLENNLATELAKKDNAHITDTCRITAATVHDISSLILKVSYSQLLPGTLLEDAHILGGLIGGQLEVGSLGMPVLMDGTAPITPRSTSQDATNFRITAPALPDGIHTYGVALSYDIEERQELMGMVIDTHMIERSDPCGSLTIDKQHGQLVSVSVNR